MGNKQRIDKIIDLLDSLAYSEQQEYIRTHDKKHYYRMQMCDEIMFKVVNILKECDK